MDDQRQIYKNVSEKIAAEERASSSLFWNRLLLGLVTVGLVLVAVKGANSKEWRQWFGTEDE